MIRLAHICRHPIKAHGREDLASVLLSAGACLPFDRHWAVAHEAAKLTEGWNPCANFTRGAKAPALMAITSTLEEDSLTVMLRHPERPAFRFRPDDPADLPGFLDWVRPLCPPDRAQPAQIVSAGRGMTDSDFPSVAVLSLASLRDLSAKMGRDLSIHRWRGNLWLEHLPAWGEFSLIGKELRIGTAVLRVEERITRCRATMADPETGRIDADTLTALSENYGHRDFGIYATVLHGGRIAVTDTVELR